MMNKITISSNIKSHECTNTHTNIRLSFVNLWLMKTKKIICNYVKKTIHVIAFLSLSILGSSNIYPQLPCDIKFFLIPQNPTPTDSIRVHVGIGYNNIFEGWCGLDSIFNEKHNNTFYYEGFIRKLLWTGSGMCQIPISIGKLESGEYRLIFDANYYFFDGIDTIRTFCTDTLYFEVKDTMTNLTSYNKNNSKVELYPNPASNHITVETTANQHLPYQLEIFDITGRIVHSEVLSESKTLININMLHSGMYFAKIQQGSHVQLKKFIKN